jgi:hypothetical protein
MKDWNVLIGLAVLVVWLILLVLFPKLRVPT